MKRSGTCPKCQSRRIASGSDGSLYVCVDCGFYERYMHPRVIQSELENDELELVNPQEGPFR